MRYYILYIKLKYARILIGSHLWSIGGQTIPSADTEWFQIVYVVMIRNVLTQYVAHCNIFLLWPLASFFSLFQWEILNRIRAKKDNQPKAIAIHRHNEAPGKPFWRFLHETKPSTNSSED